MSIWAATGLRRGEILGLKWTDFVWTDTSRTAAVLTVSRALTRVTGEGVKLGDTKTLNGRRDIDVPPFAVEALKRRYLIQQQERVEAGERWGDTGLVVTARHGHAFKPEEVRRVHRAALKKAGVPSCRFHDLRHTTATLLLAKKVPMKMVSTILGHANFQFTTQVYGHVLEPMRKEAPDALNQIYSPKQLPAPDADAPMGHRRVKTTVASFVDARKARFSRASPPLAPVPLRAGVFLAPLFNGGTNGGTHTLTSDHPYDSTKYRRRCTVSDSTNVHLP